MVQKLEQEAALHGGRLKVLPIRHLGELQTELEHFKENESLNGFQKWIVSDLYKFDPPVEFEAESVIIVAIPHPSYAHVALTFQGRTYHTLSLVMPDFNETEGTIKAYLEPRGYHMKKAPNLPMKRLAARSGLASYGRNNICYVDGMGSCVSFDAYFTDLPAKEGDCWSEISVAKACEHCKICFHQCPTGAIREERFLIDNERCLSFFNEVPNEFPEWLPLSVHHTLYDCLKCQVKCPMNKESIENVIGPILFDEEETRWLLTGGPLDKFPPALRQKSELLGLNQWLEAIPRNLKVLFELSDKDNGSASPCK